MLIRYKNPVCGDCLPVRGESGFTLIEALVAMFIFSWIGLGAYQILDQVILAEERNKVQSKRMAALQKASWQIGKDFRQMVNRPVRDNEGRLLPFLIIGGDENLVEFTRAGWSNPLQWPRSELQRVAYRVDYHPQSGDPESLHYGDEQLYLIRLYWTVLDRALDTEPYWQAILGGIADFDLQFWDRGQGEWSASLSPTFASGSSLQAYDLPYAIEIQLATDDGQLLKKILRLL